MFDIKLFLVQLIFIFLFLSTLVLLVYFLVKILKNSEKRLKISQEILRRLNQKEN